MNTTQPPILECEDCHHGRHLAPCDTYLPAGGTSLKCGCTR